MARVKLQHDSVNGSAQVVGRTMQNGQSVYSTTVRDHEGNVAYHNVAYHEGTTLLQDNTQMYFSMAVATLGS